MPNVELLTRTLEYIKEHPDKWDQKVFRSSCGTKFCFAGHAVALSGARWLSGPDTYERYLVESSPGAEPIWVSHYTGDVLGLTEDQRDALFACANTLGDLERVVGELIDNAEVSLST